MSPDAPIGSTRRRSSGLGERAERERLELARAVAVLGEQLAHGVDAELLAERLARLRLHVELLAGERCGGVRPHQRARVAGRELQPEPRERLAGGHGLALAARG